MLDYLQHSDSLFSIVLLIVWNRNNSREGRVLGDYSRRFRQLAKRHFSAASYLVVKVDYILVCGLPMLRLYIGARGRYHM